MGHALFPAPEDFAGEDKRDISWIQVERREPGRIVAAPYHFAATTLRDASDLFEKFGGGDYRLTGRNADKSRITAKVESLVLPGPPKPLAGVAAPELAAVPGAPPAHAASDGVSAWAPLIVGVAQVLGTIASAIIASGRESAAAARAEAREAAAQQQQFLATLMVRSDTQGAATQQALLAALAHRPEPAAGGANDGMLKALELGIGLGSKAAGADGDGGVESLLQHAAAGFAGVSEAKAKAAEARAAEARAREAEARARAEAEARARAEAEARARAEAEARAPARPEGPASS